jgi:hypothetical protein
MSNETLMYIKKFEKKKKKKKKKKMKIFKKKKKKNLATKRRLAQCLIWVLKFGAITCASEKREIRVFSREKTSIQFEIKNSF